MWESGWESERFIHERRVRRVVKKLLMCGRLSDKHENNSTASLDHLMTWFVCGNEMEWSDLTRIRTLRSKPQSVKSNSRGVICDFIVECEHKQQTSILDYTPGTRKPTLATCCFVLLLGFFGFLLFAVTLMTVARSFYRLDINILFNYLSCKAWSEVRWSTQTNNVQ